MVEIECLVLRTHRIKPTAKTWVVDILRVFCNKNIGPNKRLDTHTSPQL